MSIRNELDQAALLEFLKYQKLKEKHQREDFNNTKIVVENFLKFLTLETRGEAPHNETALKYFIELLKYTSNSLLEDAFLEQALTEYSDMEYFCVDHPEYRRKCLIQIRSALINAYAKHVKIESMVGLGRDAQITEKIKPYVGFSFFKSLGNYFKRSTQKDNEQWMR